jgi:hypothetical protein
MYTNLYVYTAYRQYMSGKLYWRLKKGGKWTWKPARVNMLQRVKLYTVAQVYHLEEEE